MKKYAFLITALITATLSYGYEAILTEIVNNTPNAITFVGKEVAQPMAVPTVPPQPTPPKPAGKRLAGPIIIPARSRKLINTQIVSDAESKGIAELFFNFKDKNGNIVSAIARGNRLFKFAPLLGWKRTGMEFDNPKGTYRVQFVLEGKDGISDMKIQPATRRRRTMKRIQKKKTQKSKSPQLSTWDV